MSREQLKAVLQHTDALLQIHANEIHRHRSLAELNQSEDFQAEQIGSKLSELREWCNHLASKC